MVNYTTPTLISVSNLINSGKYAVKSGSTSSDYLTIGYNKDYLVMVWNGNDDNSKVLNSESKITKNIWANTIINLPKSDDDWYQIPKGVIASIIDPISGEASLNNGMVCYYEKGSEPNYSIDDIYTIINK